MQILVVGASGATGRLLVEQLLNMKMKVKVIVRSPGSLGEGISNHENLTVIRADLHELTAAELSLHVAGCDGVASCLGHNMTFGGMFGQPRLLVTDTVRGLCGAIQANHSGGVVKFVLMNTAGNSNRDVPEKVTFAQQCVISLLRLLLPPHHDNEKAADFLRTEVDRDSKAIQWTAVRPDNLTNESEVTDYDVHLSPIRSAIFDAGSTSRINVGHFMAQLLTEDKLWNKWKGQMPVIYNRG